MNFVAKPSHQQPIKVIFCLPGPSYSGDFLSNWSELLMTCQKNNIIPLISQTYDAVVYYVRNKCLQGNVLRGKNQKPFDGKLDYDFLMWIDNDIIFNVDSFMRLLQHGLNGINIVSGIYMMKGAQNFATVKDWDEEYFKNNGSFQFLSPKDIEGKTDLMEVDYTGLGWLLAKRGVFESIEYPWFRPIFYDIDKAHDFCSEDVGFCKTVKAKGFKIHVDPTIRVGHEKKVIL